MKDKIAIFTNKNCGCILLHHDNIPGVKIKVDICYCFWNEMMVEFHVKAHEVWKVIWDNHMGPCYGKVL